MPPSSVDSEMLKEIHQYKWTETQFAQNILRALFYVSCIVVQLRNVNQQNSFFKLIFQFNSSCLLHVSNILCPSSRRLCCTCSLIWHAFHSFRQAVCQGEECVRTSFTLADCLPKRTECMPYKTACTVQSS
jgi:hypothetical protein